MLPEENYKIGYKWELFNIATIILPNCQVFWGIWWIKIITKMGKFLLLQKFGE